jgi:hypothetical protein
MTFAEFDSQNAVLEAFEGVPLDNNDKELAERKSFHERMERIARICTVIFGVFYMTTTFMLIGGVTIGNVVEYLSGGGGKRVEVYDHSVTSDALIRFAIIENNHAPGNLPNLHWSDDEGETQIEWD